MCPKWTNANGIQTEHFTRNTAMAGNPTVKDNVTGLEWQGCLAGLSGDTCNYRPYMQYSWQYALAYCEALSWAGYYDWRLPDLKELLSISDYSKVHPSIDPNVFPATMETYYWTSTTYLYDMKQAWYVDFSEGIILFLWERITFFFVRCVRSGL